MRRNGAEFESIYEMKNSASLESHTAALRQLVEFYGQTVDEEAVWQSALGIILLRMQQLGLTAELELKHPLLPPLKVPSEKFPGPDADGLSLTFDREDGSERPWLEVNRREDLADLYLKTRLIALDPLKRRMAKDIIADLRICLGLQVIFRQTAQFAGEVDKDEQQRRVRALTSLAMVKDGTQRHIVTVAVNVSRVGRMLAGEAFTEEKTWGALLHDLGKVGVPLVILKKPDKPTDYEWEVLRQHIPLGVQIAQRVGLPAETVEVIERHHENQDGSGYPKGLSNGQIPLAASITRVIDTVDAMTAPSAERGWRSSASIDEVIKQELSNLAGKRYLVEAVTAVQELYRRGELILPSSLYLSERRFLTDPLFSPILPSRASDFS